MYKGRLENDERNTKDRVWDKIDKSEQWISVNRGGLKMAEMGVRR